MLEKSSSPPSVSVVVLFVVGLLVLNRAYLRPYDSAGGQLVLMCILGLFAGSFVAMERIGRIQMPQRFIGRRAETAASR